MCPPVAVRPIGVGSSKPTHTPAQTFGVKPQNQALVLSLVVPVLPAPVLVKPSSYALRPVPSFSAVCRRSTTM